MQPKEGSIYSLDIINNGALLQNRQAKPTFSDRSWAVLPYVVPYEGSHFAKFYVETWHKLQGSKVSQRQASMMDKCRAIPMKHGSFVFQIWSHHQAWGHQCMYAFGKVQPTSVVWINTPTLHIVNLFLFDVKLHSNILDMFWHIISHFLDLLWM
jgi:hypothetical protein